MAGEIGIADFAPVLTERTERPIADTGSAVAERWSLAAEAPWSEVVVEEPLYRAELARPGLWLCG